MSDDGRLDLDELGAVIEGASSVDRPADVVSDGAGSTWGERLEAAGVTPFARRHRVAVGVAALAAVVVGVGTTAWLRAQPPPWREPTVSVVAASLDQSSGPYLAVRETRLAAAAYVPVVGDPTVSVRIDGLEGPGIRASATTGPRAGGNPDATVVSAVVGCGSDAIRAQTRDFHLRITTTDSWGRERAGLADVPATDFGWADFVRQACWQEATQGSLRVERVSAQVDDGAAAVVLQIDVDSAMPYDALVRADGIDLDALRIPWTGEATGLAAGGSTPVTVRLEVTDCSAGAPAVPTTEIPDDPVEPRSYGSAEGIALVVSSPDQQAGAVVPLAFSAEQSTEIRRALADACSDVPPFRVTDLQVVRTVPDEALGTTTLTMIATTATTPGRLAQIAVGISPRYGPSDPAAVAWSLAPAGGGPAEITWTFACTELAGPPYLAVRFVDNVRPTPLRVPLDQETVAPWVSDACPLLTPDTLVDGGWSLP